MGIRRKARELTLQALYQGEYLKTQAVEHFSVMADNFQVNQKAKPYALELLEGVCNNLEAIDLAIGENADNWRLDRMSAVDRNIIRIGAFELLFKDEVPDTVAINEAIEIAKKYSTDDAGPFINGILDGIRKAPKK